MLGSKGIPYMGGIQHYIEHLGARLVQRGHEVVVYGRRQYVAEPALYRGMERRHSWGLKGKHLDAPTHTLTAAWAARRGGFDVIHIHGSAQSFVLPLLRRTTSARTVVTIHGLDWRGRKWNRLASWCMRQAAAAPRRYAHATTAVSQVLVRTYEAEFGYAPQFVPTGVEPAGPVPAQMIAERGLSPNRYVLCVSRLVPEKGVHHLLEAFRDLDCPYQLVIAGASNYRDPYVQRLQALANDRVQFLGYVQGRLLAELYSHAYLMVQPSDLEGLPLTVLEALSYGRCVLASDIEPNVEALGGCGYTFRQGDVADLRQHLAHLLGHPELVAGEQQKAQTYIAEERNWERTADAFEYLYSQLVERALG